ncbi:MULTISPECIES: CCA tRNA nucleotidyltransferase [unclassified Exiguobacterium]|uniref:CCA tRNA nucleotidyltransferase n=1 Tax=unclassified Exiguobacterium TaxID=2644629 RepID=UPI002036FEC7|nr:MULTISPECIES: CCA tRNA nucleotidyltransferase [unclassified Exiguobacterium]
MKMSELANTIIETIERAGGEAYVVGGAVRDTLLGRVPGDYDLATSLLPDEVIPLFPVVIPTGLEHGTVTIVLEHVPFEVTTFRSESTYSDRRRPDHVTLGVSLEEDLTRRDFTINAMALKPTGLVDLFGGQADLASKIIRTVGRPEERFEEDALRMIRAFRFMSQLEFSLDGLTERAIAKQAETIQHVAIERVAIEFEKLLLGPGRVAALQAMLRTGLATYLPHVTSEVMGRLAQSSLQGVSTENVWTLLLDAGFPQERLRVFKRSKKQEQRAKRLVALVRLEQLTDWQRYTLTDEELLVLNQMTGRSHADRTTLAIRSLKDLRVGGRDMIAAGLKKQEIKEALHYLEQHVVNGHLENQRSILLEEVSKWKNQHET